MATPSSRPQTKPASPLWAVRPVVHKRMSLRIAVIGVGYLGRHHARILASMSDVDLVAVVDTNRPRAEEIAAASRTRALTDYRDVLGAVDAITLAVPTETHATIAIPFLDAGVPVLVE